MGNIDLALTDAAYNFLSRQQIERFVDKFLHHDFGYENADEIELARVKAFGKCFDLPKHKASAFGIYPAGKGIYCYVVFHAEYCEHIGRKSLIIALNTDINLLFKDPLQALIDKMKSAENNRTH